MSKILLLPCKTLKIAYREISFEINYCNALVRVADDQKNYTVINLKSQQVSYKANILGGFVSSEKSVGKVLYSNYFLVVWTDDSSYPEIVIKTQPISISRSYLKGQKIELGIEEVSSYHIKYKDNVEAVFTRTSENAFDFNFSSGFNGKFWKDEDGSHTIKFRGLRVDAEDDGYNAESKFIITRSKYTDNLLLILQDNATVNLLLQ